MFQKHSAELCRRSPGLWLHAGHVGLAGAGPHRDTERSRCLLVLRWSDAEDIVLQFTDGC